MAVIENDVIKVTVSSSSTKNVIKVSPGVAALSSVSLSLNELNDVDTTGITNGQTIVYENGSFVAGDAGAVKTVNDTNPDVDGNVNVSLSSLPDTSISNPADNDYLKYLNNRWVNDKIDISDVTGLQSSLDGKASTSSVPQSLSDLSDVTIVGTPAPNQALIFDGASGSFKSLPSFSNRFEDEAEINKQSIVPFVERVYTVKSDGDGIFIDPDPDTPSAGKVIKRNIYHKTGFLESGAVIGDFTLIHTFADDTAYSATVSTFEGFRDGNTYGTPPFTLIQTWEEVTAAPAFTGLLNEAYGSGAEAAYSTRRLNGNYSGDCMVIRRDSDGTTQSIGFVGEEIDESAIETFCTGTTCTVATWYDQSGNGNNATQPTPANQPTIYTGGQLVKEGGRLAVDFTSNNYMQSPANVLGTVTEATQIHLGAFKSTGISNQILSAVSDGAYSANDWMAIRQQNGQNQLAITSDNINNGTATTNNALFFAGIDFSAGTVNFSVDGSNVTGSITQGSRSFTDEVDISFIDNNGSPLLKTQQIAQEIIFYPSDKSSVRTDIEGNISAYFQSAKLLDEQFGEGAEAAYSTRQLRRDQTDCMVIRRASDSTTTTIGFDANGDIDEAAIETFCTGTTCTVVTWKDQSGNGNDATVPSGSDEPTIYTGGAIVKQNGRPILQSNSLTTGFVTSATGANNSTFFGLIDTDSSVSKVGVVYNGGNPTADYLLLIEDGSTSTSFNVRSGSPNTYVNGTTSSFTRNALFDFAANGSLNSVVNFDGSTYTYEFGWNDNSGIGMPSMQEAIIYPTDKSSVRTQIESNIADYFTQNTPLLDTYSGAAAAYSLRKLNSSYTGAAIEVYAGTNGTADIGFNVFGELDTVALAAHCGNQDGTVQTWYDQSGNGNHATQGVAGSQPKIYDGTTGVVTENGKPAVEFDGSGDNFVASSVSLTQAATSTIVAKTNDSNVNYFFDGDDSTNRLLAFQNSTADGFSLFGGSILASGTKNTNQNLHFALFNGASSTYHLNGNSIASGNLGSNSADGITIGARYNVDGNELNGNMQELIFWDSDQSSNRTNIEDNINTFYSIY